jgi:hypothetical protein
VKRGGWKVDVPVTVSARMRMGGAWWTSRRRIALLGIFAILFQAMLFAWHHHAHLFTLRSAPVAVPLAADCDQVPASADDTIGFQKVRTYRFPGAPGNGFCARTSAISAAVRTATPTACGGDLPGRSDFASRFGRCGGACGR